MLSGPCTLLKHSLLTLLVFVSLYATQSQAAVDIVAENASTSISASAGDTLSMSYKASNRGTTTAYSVMTQVYLATSPTIITPQNFNDYAMLNMDLLFTLAPGESVLRNLSFNLPWNLATGTYYIGVYVYSNETESNTSNNYSYHTIHITGTSCSDDNYESDNSPAAAKTLLFGQPQQHNHCNATADWVRFTAVAGTTYGISADQVGDQAWIGLTLYNSTGSTALAISRSPNWDFSAARLTWTAPASGDYLIKATPIYGPESSGANTEYTLILGDLRADLLSQPGWTPIINTVPGNYTHFYETTRNLGFAAAGPFEVGIYLSNDTNWSADDLLLGTRQVAALAVGESSNSAYPEDSYTIPADTLPGTYYILPVSDHTQSVDDYTRVNNVSAITLNVEAWNNCTPDAYEEDDTQLDAHELVVGYQGQTRNFCDDRVDWLRFNANAGIQYVISAPGGGDITYSLYGPDGSSLLLESNVSFRWVAPDSDTYYLKLTKTYSYNPASSEYTAKVEESLADLQVMLSPTINTINAGGLISTWDSVSNRGYTDSGPFTLSIYMSSDESVTRADTLLYQRDINNYSPSTYYPNPSYHLPIPKDTAQGVYYVAALVDSTDQVAELREDNNLSEVHIIYVMENTCALDSYEDDDTLAQAKPITVGETQLRTTCDDGLDWVEFYAQANQTYLVEGDGSIYEVQVYAADGITLQANEAEHFYDTFSWRPSIAGKYYFKAETQHPGGISIDYTLNVHQCVLDAYEQDDTLFTSTLLVHNELQQHNYCDDSFDYYHFEAVAGKQYYFEAVNIGYKSNVQFGVYDTSGQNRLASSPFPAPKGNKPATITWIAPADATYYIKSGDYHNWGKQREYSMKMLVSVPKGKTR